MSIIKNTKEEQKYWSERYLENRTGWDIGSPSPPFIDYINQIEDTSIKILIPGAGNAYEAEYLFNKGFKNVYVLDIAPEPLEIFQQRIPQFPSEQILIGNFFTHTETYDLILEQTFFCSFPPIIENRKAYAKKMNSLLKENGKLVGVWFDIPLKGDFEKRPFGGTKEEYLSYFNQYFNTNLFEKCYNSIPARAESELFGIFQKK